MALYLSFFSALLISALNAYTLSLWHEGLVGDACNDLTTYASYEEDVLSFAKSKNIDQVFLLVQSSANGACNSMDAILDNFLNKVEPPMKAGMVTYVRPKDSGWNINNTLPGNYNSCTLVPPTQTCPETDDSSQYPSGCPNFLTQAVWYAGQINNAAQNVKFTTIGFDGEDLGPYGAPWGMCQALAACTDYAPDILYAGYAKGPGLTPEADGGNVAYPEIYWIGELAATGCCAPGNNPQCVCTLCAPQCTNTTYVQYANDPDGFLNYLSPFLEPYIDTLSQEGVVAMFSIENLSQGLDGTGPNCIANKYFGNGTPKTSICGTFNGFSYWDYDSFVEFLDKFSAKYNVDQLAIYEAQFIPDTWM